MSLFNNLKKFLFGNSIKAISGLFSGYFFALILGPSLYGIWQTAKVFIGYGSFINLGIPYTFQRDYPTLIKNNKKEESIALRKSLIGFSFITFPLMALVILIVFFSYDFDNNYFRFALLAVALWFIISLPGSIGTVINKVVNDYKSVSRAEIIFGLGLLTIIPFVYYFGFYALISGFLLVTLVHSIYYYRHKPFDYGFKVDFKIIRYLIKISFPIFLLHISVAVFSSIDRLIIANNLGFEEVGLYSLSSFLSQPITLIVSSSSIVLFTYLNEKYGAKNDTKLIDKHVFIPQNFFSNILPPLIGFGLLLLPFIVEFFLPKYKEGVIAAQINIFSIFFYALAGFAANALFVLNKQKLSALSFAIAGIIKTVGSFIAIKLGYGIEGVAVFSLTGYFIYNTLMIYFISKQSDIDFKSRLKIFFQNNLPVFLMIAYCVSSIAVFLPFLKNYTSSFISLIIIELILIILFLPFVIRSYNIFLNLKKK